MQDIDQLALPGWLCTIMIVVLVYYATIQIVGAQQLAIVSMQRGNSHIIMMCI